MYLRYTRGNVSVWGIFQHQQKKPIKLNLNSIICSNVIKLFVKLIVSIHFPFKLVAYKSLSLSSLCVDRQTDQRQSILRENMNKIE